jgi:hypothetical protein
MYQPYLGVLKLDKQFEFVEKNKANKNHRNLNTDLVLDNEVSLNDPSQAEGDQNNQSIADPSPSEATPSSPVDGSLSTPSFDPSSHQKRHYHMSTKARFLLIPGKTRISNSYAALVHVRDFSETSLLSINPTAPNLGY